MNFYNFCNFNSNIIVENKFNYNFYEKDETLTDDSQILKSNDYNSKEIELSVTYDAGYDKSILFLKKYIDSLDINYLSSLDNQALSDQDINYINNIQEKNDFLRNISKLREEKIALYNSMFNVNINNFRSSFEKSILDSKKISIDRRKINLLKNKNNKNIFFDDHILRDNNDFYLNETAITRSIKEKSNFTDSLLSYNEKTIFSESSIYFLHVGIIVLKFKKVDNTYRKLSNKFFINKNISISLYNNSKIRNIATYNFKDKAVKYGENYKYIVYPVFNVSLPKFKDFHIVEDFLYCDIPFSTEDIVCKENNRPLPPVNIDFNYIENKNRLLITWKPDSDLTGDQKGYQIFKRHSLEEPFKLVKNIEYHLETDFYERNSLIPLSQVEKRKEDIPLEYYDTFNKEKISIYAICTIDAHGFVSNYSSQIGVKYNYFTKKVEVDLVSSPGAPLFYPNLFVKRKTKFFDNDDKIVTITPYAQNISKISLYATPDFAIISNNNDSTNNNLLYKENYKLNIFKVENSKNFIDDIEIKNFNLN